MSSPPIPRATIPRIKVCGLRELARFDADIRVIAERYRFPVVDVRQPLMKAPDQAGMMFPDRLHYTERAHRIMADEVMRAFEDGTIEIPR